MVIMSNSTYLVANGARCAMLIIAFFVAIPMLQAQHQKEYLAIEANGVTGSQVKTVSLGDLVKVLTTGGYVNVYFTDLFKSTPNLNSRVYFIDKSAKKPIEPPPNGLLYLQPGNEYLFKVFQASSGTLIKRYILQRPKLLPIIEFSNNHGRHLFTTGTSGKDAGITLSPAEKMRLDIRQDKDFGPMEVEYSLRNLKTKQIQYGSGRYTFKGLTFTANTDYELRVNYLVQKETVSTIYIQVKPHWYQSWVTYAIVLMILLSIASWLVLSRFNKKISLSRKEQQKLEQAAIRLQSLLNPHFTFNALSSIQGLMNTGRIDEANQYLQEFSSLLRQTLAKSQQVYTTLDQELDIIRLYIKLEAFRFNFFWEIDISPDLNPATIEIPTLLLQPLVENAIKHGLSKLAEQGKLQVSCKTGLKSDTFVISIQDNGTWINKTGPGYGLALTNERIATINKMKKGQSITLEFKKDTGTNAMLTFHNWIEN